MKRVLLCVAALMGCAGAGDDTSATGDPGATAIRDAIRDQGPAAAAPGPPDGDTPAPELSPGAAPTTESPPRAGDVPPQTATAPPTGAPPGEPAPDAAAAGNAVPTGDMAAGTADGAAPPPAPTDASPPGGQTGADLSLYPDALSGAGAPRPYGPEPPPVLEWIEIVLRSTPPGATVSVDGALVGTTPTFWRGAKLPVVREFRFEFERFQTAEFRFVPVRSGVLHPTLAPTRTKPDAGP